MGSKQNKKLDSGTCIWGTDKNHKRLPDMPSSWQGVEGMKFGVGAEETIYDSGNSWAAA